MYALESEREELRTDHFQSADYLLLYVHYTNNEHFLTSLKIRSPFSKNGNFHIAHTSLCN